MVATLESKRLTEVRDPRLYSVQQLLGTPDDENDRGLLENWLHYAETGREPDEISGYDVTIGRTNVAEVAAFVKAASIYADIDAALPKDRRGAAVRLYFRGMLDTRPALRNGRLNATFGHYCRPNFHQVRQALRCRYGDVRDLIVNGVVELLVKLCGVRYGYARYRVEKWWEARVEGWNKTRLP